MDTEQDMREIKSFSNKIALTSKDSTLIYKFLKSIQAKADTFEIKTFLVMVYF